METTVPTEPYSLGDLLGQLDARSGGVGGEHPVAALRNVHRGAPVGRRAGREATADPGAPNGDIVVQQY